MIRFTYLYIEMCLKASAHMKEFNKAPELGDYYYIENRKTICICVGKDDEYYEFKRCLLKNDKLIFSESLSEHENSKMQWLPTTDQLINLAAEKNDFMTLESLLKLYDKEYKIGLLEQLICIIVSSTIGLIWSIVDLDFITEYDIQEKIKKYNEIKSN